MRLGGDNFNRYAYAFNNPYKFTDPDGRDGANFYTDPNMRMAQPSGEGAGLIADFLPVVGDIKGFVDFARNPTLANGAAAIVGLAGPLGDAAGKVLKNVDNIGDAAKAADFDTARKAAFDNAGMNDPSKVQFSEVDEKTGTIVEFKGEGGAKVGYDGPHASPGPHHDTQHISWQSAGKRGDGGAQRGNIPYSGERHPSRPDRKDQK